VNIVIVVVNIATSSLFGKPMHLFDVDKERNIATWWSSAQLLVAGLIFAILANRNAKVRPSGGALILLAGLLVLMAMDEIAGLHEKIGNRLDLVLGDRDETIFNVTGLWFVVIGLPFAVLVIALLRQMSAFLAEAPGTRPLIALGFGLLLLGAIGFEALSNFAVPADHVGPSSEASGYFTIVLIEETLEMMGGSVLVWASLHLALAHWSTRGIGRYLVPLDPQAVTGTGRN
jgi:hypothetical protein